jgi:predicted DNA-binding protein
MARKKSEVVREQTGMRLRLEILRALRHLSIDLGKPVSLLVEEAAEDYLKKHGKMAELQSPGDVV